jgi:O-antigen/teichoic acid export membrane protein
VGGVVTLDAYIYWVLTVLMSMLAGWWLAARPGASMRGIATPVSLLILALACLLCVLALKRTDGRTASPIRGATFPLDQQSQGE